MARLANNNIHGARTLEPIGIVAAVGVPFGTGTATAIVAPTGKPTADATATYQLHVRRSEGHACKFELSLHVRSARRTGTDESVSKPPSAGTQPVP